MFPAPYSGHSSTGVMAVAGAVTSVEDAVDHVNADLSDLVLMDIELAGDLDGVTTAERIHAQHDLPIIHLTGHNDGETLQRAKVSGPSGYIIKPFETRDLHIAIDSGSTATPPKRNCVTARRWRASDASPPDWRTISTTC